MRLPSNKNIDYFSTYTYDANGNRASATVNGKTTTASYTLDDQLEVYGDNTYYYDEDGYLSEKTTPEGTTTYAYGTLGQLLSVETPTQSIEYLHNANNQRVAKKVNGVITKKYLWADLTTLLAVYDGNDNLVQRFEYAGSRMPIAMTYNAQKYYLHYDQVGSLRAVSDTSHNLVKEVAYDTFGNILVDSDPAFKVPFGFAGGLYDADTGLTRFGYRDYDAYTGKWTAKDPIGFNGGDTNLYGYVLGDPVNFVDFFGLQSWPNDPVLDLFNSMEDAFVQANSKSVVGDIVNGLARDIPKAYNNAHPAAQACLDVALTIVEYGPTKPLGPLYEAFSGYYFPTYPTSPAGVAGNAVGQFE